MLSLNRARGLRLLALLVPLLLLPVSQAGAEPADAILASVTPKPWMAAATPAPEQPGTNPPSSLTDWEEEPTAAPTPAPTPVPEQEIALPGVLALDNPSVFRFLLIGTDAYTLKQSGRSDTMILLQVNTRTRDIRMVSFLRDLYVKIPDHGKTRLNAAYVYGGAELLKRTLETNFGVTVDRTLAVNFSLMAELVDRIGGVEVEVSEKERKQLNSILKYYNQQNGYKTKDQLLEDSGLQNLTGKQALCYSRIRKIDSDFARTGRQRKVLEAVYRRVSGLDGLTMAGILTETLSKVKTDMTLADAVALVPVLLQLNDVEFDELTVPVRNGYESQTVSGMMVLVPNLDRNRDAIAAFLQ